MRRKRGIQSGSVDEQFVVGLGSLIALEIALVALFIEAGWGNAVPERVEVVCGLVVQMDSFLGAAYLGGLFIYGSVIYQKTKHFPNWWNFFIISLVGFGGSGLVALGGALTGNSLYLLFALVLFLYGVFVAGVVLYRVHTELSQVFGSSLLVMSLFDGGEDLFSSSGGFRSSSSLLEHRGQS